MNKESIQINFENNGNDITGIVIIEHNGRKKGRKMIIENEHKPAIDCFNEIVSMVRSLLKNTNWDKDDD